MGRPPSNSPGRPSNASLNRRGTYYVLPPVPEAIAQAIRSNVQPNLYMTRIRNLTIKLQDQHVRIEKYTNKIKALEMEKEEQLLMIRESHQQKTQQRLAQLESELRERHDQEVTKKRKEFDAKIAAELERRRAEFRKVQATKYNHEPARKRIKLLKEAAASTTTEDNEDGAIAAIYQPALQSIERKSDGLKEKYLEAESSLEKLNESRSDMIWLLKMAIQMEAKAKLKKHKEGSAK